jgi:hypothetical protein
VPATQPEAACTSGSTRPLAAHEALARDLAVDQVPVDGDSHALPVDGIAPVRGVVVALDDQERGAIEIRCELAAVTERRRDVSRGADDENETRALGRDGGWRIGLHRPDAANAPSPADHPPRKRTAAGVCSTLS